MNLICCVIPHPVRWQMKMDPSCCRALYRSLNRAEIKTYSGEGLTDVSTKIIVMALAT
jgi:hypothetical protein